MAIFSNLEMDEEEMKEAASILKNLMEEDDGALPKNLSEDRWYQCFEGSVRNGHLVRIKKTVNNKYSGRVGRIIRAGYGRARVNFICGTEEPHYFNVEDIEYFM